MAAYPGRPDATPAPGPGRPGAAPARPAGRPGADSDSGMGGTLVIGREIEVKGEIGSCQTLVVEGRLEASVVVGSLQLAESGFVDGKAEVEDADIAGRFEGDLTVNGQLLLRPTARVNGSIRYGRIVIEAGGEISGEVSVLQKGGKG